jgi:hypothetical protein
MGRIRQYQPQDAAQVLTLHQRTLLGNVPPAPAFACYLNSFYGSMLFDHPWVDDDLSSLVYEQDDGRVTGFIAVIPRPMKFHDRSVRAAVSVRFMVDPDSPRGALTAATLYRRLLSGPQDLTYMENGNTAARRVWLAAGDVAVVPVSSLSWAATTSLSDTQASSSLGDRDIGVPELLQCIDIASQRFALRPDYDYDSLRWLVDFLDSARYRGTLRRRAVTDESGRVQGWYLYYANSEGYNGVLQLHALGGKASEIFRGLLADVERVGGAPVTTGRLQPGLLPTLADQECALSFGPWMLAHARDIRIMKALVAGDAFITRLEGEFC